MLQDATHINTIPVMWDKAKDYRIWDINGKEYIDFTSSIFVTNCGHDAVREAIKDQADKLIHAYTYPTQIKQDFIKKLEGFLPSFCEKIYFACAGTEVTNYAHKLMCAYKNRDVVVHFDGAFHGKLGKVGEFPTTEIKLSFPIFEDGREWETHKKILLDNLDSIAGVMIETFQGWRAKFMSKIYTQNLVQFCKDNDIPVCFDEVQAGFYRTGKKFGYEWYEVEPDLLCLGKALGGGMPISAVTGRSKYFILDDMSSTHSGHPVCCAAGMAALDVYEKLDKKELEDKGNLLGTLLTDLQKKHEHIVYGVQYHGLIGAILVGTKKFADQVSFKCQEKGLLVVNTGRESIKIGPPLVITKEALITGIKIIEESIVEVLKLNTDNLKKRIHE